MGHRVVVQQPTQIVEEDIPGKLKQLAELYQLGINKRNMTLKD